MRLPLSNSTPKSSISNSIIGAPRITYPKMINRFATPSNCKQIVWCVDSPTHPANVRLNFPKDSMGCGIIFFPFCDHSHVQCAPIFSCLTVSIKGPIRWFHADKTTNKMQWQSINHRNLISSQHFIYDVFHCGHRKHYLAATTAAANDIRDD